MLHLSPGESRAIISVTRERLADAVKGQANQTLGAIAAAQTDNLIGMACDPEARMPTSPTQVAGVNAVYGDLDCPPDKVRIVIAANGGYAYYIDFGTDASTFNSYLPALTNLLDSWSWT